MNDDNKIIYDKELERNINLRRQLLISLAKDNFYVFCHVIDPYFYQAHRTHLKTLCDTLQSFYERKLINPSNGKPYRKLRISLPPRHGKSRTLILFTSWVLGKNQKERIITASYNDDTSQEFSRYTRDTITAKKNLPHEIIYSDIFNVKIQQGHASYNEWALDGQFFSYKGTGLGGSITGKGSTIAISDDLVKDAETAYNETSLEKIWQWYTGTFISRHEEQSLEIMNMTRWSNKDPIGRIMNSKDKDNWYHLVMPVIDDNDNMLCKDLMSYETYQEKLALADVAIFQANYLQQPIEAKGLLYGQGFKTYESLPINFETIINYTDTADEGKDFLASGCFGIKNGKAYMLDILYTQEHMSITESLTAEMLVKNKVNLCRVESNNGGGGFARSVEDIIYRDYNARNITIKTFHQTQNKLSRIYTNATKVLNAVIMPHDWQIRYPDFYKSIMSYSKEGKNKHDDGPDMLTGVAEMLDNNIGQFDYNRVEVISNGYDRL